MSQDFSIWNSLLSFIVVLVCIPLALWLYKRTQLQRRGSNAQLRVIESIGVGARERVVLIEACGEKLLIGVSGQSVHLLKPAAINHALAGSASEDFAGHLLRARQTDLPTLSPGQGTQPIGQI
jgi:flagellar biosynthetic protein FliO